MFAPTVDLVDDCLTLIDAVVPLDSCPALPGNDAVFNFMNYLDKDICFDDLGNFTPNQIERMWRHYLIFREQVSSCSSGEREIEVVIIFDDDHEDDEAIIRLIDETEDAVVFDSTTDTSAIFFYIRDDIELVMDFCVPDCTDYLLSVTEAANDNGFSSGGVIDIYVDRIRVERVEGDFGDGIQVPIPGTEECSSSSKSSKVKSKSSKSARPRELRRKPNSAKSSKSGSKGKAGKSSSFSCDAKSGKGMMGRMNGRSKSSKNGRVRHAL